MPNRPTLLALRYSIAVLVLLALIPLLKPQLPKGRAALDIAVTGFLIQVVYFGLCYIAFKSGVSAGGVAIIVCLQPILVSPDRPPHRGRDGQPVAGSAWPLAWAERHCDPRPLGDAARTAAGVACDRAGA